MALDIQAFYLNGMDYTNRFIACFLHNLYTFEIRIHTYKLHNTRIPLQFRFRFIPHCSMLGNTRGSLSRLGDDES